MTNIEPWYQQTEIGIIPEDWEVRELGDVANIKSGGTPSTARWDFWNGKILWCTPTDITNFSGKILTKTSRTITELGLKNSSADLLPIGTILMTSRATIGECVIAGKEISTNQGFKNFICHNWINNEFLYFLLKTQKEKFLNLCNGSTFLEISATQIRNFKIPLPKNPAEQSAIAEILSDVDDLITNLDKKIAKRKNIKSATMEQLLTGKIRLAGFDDEWEEKELGEIAIFLKWKWLAKKDIQKNWKYKCIHYWELFTHYKEIISDIKSYTNIYNNPTLSENNDILFPTSDVTPKWLAKASCIQENGIVLWWDILVVRPIWNQLNGKFFAYFVSHNPEKILIFATGTTVFHLYAKDLKNLKIPLPKNPTEQSAIAEILSNMDREISDLEAKKQKYQKIKSALMEQLLTGKIRISA